MSNIRRLELIPRTSNTLKETWQEKTIDAFLESCIWFLNFLGINHSPKLRRIQSYQSIKAHVDQVTSTNHRKKVDEYRYHTDEDRQRPIPESITRSIS